MRIPHTVAAHAFEAFRCSEETILLPGEQNRTLRAENEEWDETGVPPELKSQALWVIARNWRKNPLLDELPTSVDRDYLLELLPLDLPFEFAITKIPYEHFWKRAAEARWGFNDPSLHGDSWLRLYCERHLSEYLERLNPAFFATECDECLALIALVREHVQNLELRQLVPLRASIPTKAPPIEEEDNTFIEPMLIQEPDIHHVPMDIILINLPHLRTISINIGMIYMTDSVEWRDFEFSVEDSLKIGRGAKSLEHLRKFSLTRSNLDRPRAAAILQGLAVNTNLVEIDFSHCKLDDQGAHAIGAFLSQRRSPGRLKVLRLTDNGIAASGMAGLVRGLLSESIHTARITRLDLRLNPIGDDGAVHLAALLLRTDILEYLNVSGCSLGGDGGMAMAEVLASGNTKFSNLQLDCSNNDFGMIVGEAFELVAKACVAITELDVRMCGFRKESEFSISESINRNRASMQKKKSLEKRRSSIRVAMRRMPSLIPPQEFLSYQMPPYDLPDIMSSTISRSTIVNFSTIAKSSTIGMADLESDANEDEGSGGSSGVEKSLPPSQVRE